jgi:hypothetical protein
MDRIITPVGTAGPVFGYHNLGPISRRRRREIAVHIAADYARYVGALAAADAAIAIREVFPTADGVIVDVDRSPSRPFQIYSDTNQLLWCRTSTRHPVVESNAVRVDLTEAWKNFPEMFTDDPALVQIPHVRLTISALFAALTPAQPDVDTAPDLEQGEA